LNQTTTALREFAVVVIFNQVDRVSNHLN